MLLKPNVVAGEAPESDSDEELNISDGVAVPTSTVFVKGKVIAGEAPESDDETLGHSRSIDSISSAMSASSFSTKFEKKQKVARKDSSLLTKKLCERNESLAKNMNDFVSHAICTANNELNSTDQLLLKCQVQVQEASEVLRGLNSKVCQLDVKIQSLLSTTFIPKIIIPSKDEILASGPS